MSNELTLYEKMANPIEAAEKMGEWIARSGMFGCEKVEQGQILALACMSEQMSPFEVARTYHIIKGNLSMRSDAMMARARSMGAKHRIKSRTPDLATVEIERDGEWYTFSLSWEEAQGEDYTKGKGGTIKDNYATPRKRMQMLWARVVSDAVRTVYPEVVAGVYTPEEVGDYAPQPVQLGEVEAETVSEQAQAAVDFAREAFTGGDEPPLIADAERAIGDNEELLNWYLCERGHIADDETWRDLDNERIRHLVESADGVITKAGEYRAAKQAEHEAEEVSNV